MNKKTKRANRKANAKMAYQAVKIAVKHNTVATIGVSEDGDPMVVVVPWSRFEELMEMTERVRDRRPSREEIIDEVRKRVPDSQLAKDGHVLEEVLASAEATTCEDSSLLAWGSALMLDEDEKADFEAWWKERHAQVGPTAENLWGQGDMEMPTSGQATQ